MEWVGNWRTVLEAGGPDEVAGGRHLAQAQEVHLRRLARGVRRGVAWDDHHAGRRVVDARLDRLHQEPQLLPHARAGGAQVDACVPSMGH